MNRTIADDPATVCQRQVKEENEVSLSNMDATLLVDTITNLNPNHEFNDQSKNNLTIVPVEQQSVDKHNNDNNNKRNTSNISTESNTSSHSSERRYRPQKFCAVCGDKAIACNFNAVTCESCKAFFRRNAFKEQRLKCLFDSCCIIDRVTRRFCSKCRLLKCFQIGMKREWILTDEQKQIKREKIQLNKQSRLQFSAAPSPSQSEDSPKQQNSDHMANSSFNQRQERLNLQAESLDDNLPNSRRRQSSLGGSSSSSSGGSIRKVETKDATTSCSTQADLAHQNNRFVHYCSLASQCQYCSSRLTSIQNMNDHYSLRTHQSHQLPVLPNQMLYASPDIEQPSENHFHHHRQSSNNFENVVGDRACTSQVQDQTVSQNPLCSSNCCCYFRTTVDSHHSVQVNHLPSKQPNEIVPVAQADASFQQVPQLHLMTPTQASYFANTTPPSLVSHKFQPQFITDATGQSYYPPSTRTSSNDSQQEALQTQEAGTSSNATSFTSNPTNC